MYCFFFKIKTKFYTILHPSHRTKTMIKTHFFLFTQSKVKKLTTFLAGKMLGKHTQEKSREKSRTKNSARRSSKILLKSVTKFTTTTTTPAPSAPTPKKKERCLRRCPIFRVIVMNFESVFKRNLLELLAELFVWPVFS